MIYDMIHSLLRAVTISKHAEVVERPL